MKLQISSFRFRLLAGALFYKMDEKCIKLIQLLLTRLERISANPVWAHRASGISGVLIRGVEQLETDQIVDSTHEN